MNSSLAPVPEHVLVLSPHPDDESIGCGGVLRRHIQRGNQIHVLFLTSGEKGGHGRSPEETISLREQEAREAAAILGIQQISFWRQPDGALQPDLELVQRLQRFLREWRPGHVYAPHEAEVHPDHVATVQLLRHALADFPQPERPRCLLYEVWTPLQVMHEIVDITAEIEIKMAAVQAYRSQCEVVSFDEAVRGLNRYRGEMHCWPTGEYAEVFKELKW